MIHGRRRQRVFLVVLGLLLLLPYSASAGTRGGALNRFGSGISQVDQPPPAEMPAGTLQALIDAAPSGSTLLVPRGIYRETVVIDKPLALVGEAGAEIRGSDLWLDGWRQQDGYWRRPGAPQFETTGEWCRDGSNGRCNWPAQVFHNGAPLTQVQGPPASGQFALADGQEIVLADDPAGAQIEVTTRRTWIITAADDVRIQGLTMRHAADELFAGALSNDGHANWSLVDNHLLHAHIAVVALRQGTHLRVLNNEIAYGGRLGIQSWQAAFAEIRGNDVHSNNTEAFEDGWEAGGMKLSGLSNSAVSGNAVHHNDGAGIWCDVGCSAIEISNNRVHDNRRYGILYEISSGGRIIDNELWENGWGFSDWGFGAGFVCQNCRDTEVAGNIVAWNADGISIMSQPREGFTDVVNNHVHDNLIILTTDWSQNTYMLAWLEDWSGGLTDPASNNRGSGNRYFHATPEDAFLPFTWGQSARFGIDDLAGFNATPGEENGVLIGAEEALAVLADHAMPLTPQTRP
jgi:parallel beta-helix repeat protein